MTKALPLRGLRVVNLGWVWAGPVVGQTLAFLGAEVLKVESRSRVDTTRKMPAFHQNKPDPDRSLSNHALWAGNGSVSLNFKQPEALELLKQLIACSDVVVENFSPGVMERLGLSYPELCRVKQDIILLSLSSAGLNGPMKNLRTYGTTLTALTGLDSLTGYKGEMPAPVENAYTDPYTGILGGFAVLGALRHRNRTGEGQHIDFSQHEAVMQLTGPAYMDYVFNGRIGGTKGNTHPLNGAAPHGVFPCRGKDRWISIAISDDAHWRDLVKELESPESLSGEEFATLSQRLARIDELHERLGACTKPLDARELTDKLQARGVCAAPVLNVGDLLHDEHLRARNTFIEVEHPLGFKETIYGAYVKTSRAQPVVRPGGAIGQDNSYVFKEILGLSEQRYADLIERQVIY